MFPSGDFLFHYYFLFFAKIYPCDQVSDYLIESNDAFSPVAVVMST